MTEQTAIEIVQGEDYMHLTTRVTLFRFTGSVDNARRIQLGLEALGAGVFDLDQASLQGSLFNASKAPELALTVRALATGIEYSTRLMLKEWGMIVQANGRLIALTKLPWDADLSYIATGPTIVL